MWKCSWKKNKKHKFVWLMSSEESIYPEIKKRRDKNTRYNCVFSIHSRNNFFYVTNESSSIKWCVSLLVDQTQLQKKLLKSNSNSIGEFIQHFFNIVSMCNRCEERKSSFSIRCNSSLLQFYVVEFMIIINNIILSP